MTTREHDIARDKLHEAEVRIALLRGKIEGAIDGIRDDKAIIAACAAQSKRTGEPASDIMDKAVEDARARHLPKPDTPGPISDTAPVEPAVAKFRELIG